MWIGSIAWEKQYACDLIGSRFAFKKRSPKMLLKAKYSVTKRATGCPLTNEMNTCVGFISAEAGILVVWSQVTLVIIISVIYSLLIAKTSKEVAF